MSWIKRIFGIAPEWREIERFDPAWRQRIQEMARHISQEDKSVVDVGCGPMWLREYLPAGIAYSGIDYKDRGPGSLVCDINRERLPEIRADVYFISGCLEYIVRPKDLAEAAAGLAERCIVSYCTMESFGDINDRRRRGWVNHLSASQVVDLFAIYGMKCHNVNHGSGGNSLFVFAHTQVHEEKK